MNDKAGKQEPETNPDHQNDPEEPEKLNGRKRISRVSVGLALGIVFAFLAAWAGLFGNLGHTYWIFAASLMSVATVVLALGLRLELRNHHWLKWQYTGLSSLVAMIGLTMGVQVIVREILHSEPKPHFKFMLSTSEFLEARLSLTNEFLTVPQYGGRFDISGYVFVPQPQKETHVCLRFIIVNDSPTFAEHIMVSASAPKTWACIPDPAWQKSGSPLDGSMESISGGKKYELESWSYTPSDLLPGCGTLLPNICVPTNASPYLNMGIIARAKDSPTSGVAFILRFCSTNISMKPFAVAAKRNPSNGVDTITISAERLKELSK